MKTILTTTLALGAFLILSGNQTEAAIYVNPGYGYYGPAYGYYYGPAYGYYPAYPGEGVVSRTLNTLF